MTRNASSVSALALGANLAISRIDHAGNASADRKVRRYPATHLGWRRHLR